MQGASGVIYHHQNNVTQALLDLFPDIGLQKTIFWAKCMSLYLPLSPSSSRTLSLRELIVAVALQNRRQFFADFAARRGFDPRDPEKWYSVHPGDIMACEVNNHSFTLTSYFLPSPPLLPSSFFTLAYVFLGQMGDDARTSRRIKRIKT